jgi:hypothetical protein
VDENHDIIYKANSSSMKPMKLGIQKGVDDILREREREREQNTRVGWLHKNFQSFKVFPQLVSFILIFSFFLFSFYFLSLFIHLEFLKINYNIIN